MRVSVFRTSSDLPTLWLFVPVIVGTPLIYAYRWIVPEPYWPVGVGVLIAAVVGYIWYWWLNGAEDRHAAAERRAELEAEHQAHLEAIQARIWENEKPASLMEIEELVANAPPEWRRMLVRLLWEEAQRGRQFSKGTIGRLNDYVHGRLSEDEPIMALDAFGSGPQADFIMKLQRRYDRSW